MIRLLVIITGMSLSLAAGVKYAGAETAEANYRFYCAQCHGLTGKGDGPNVTKDMPVTPRDFTSSETMNKLSDGDLKNVILSGGPVLSKSVLMPAWRGTFSDSEVDDLVKYLRKLCNCKGK